MANQPNRHSSFRLSRRSLIRSSAAVLSAPFIARTTGAWAQDKLTGTGEVVVFSYGGSMLTGSRQHVYEPFTKATGIKVVDVVADVAEPQVKAMAQAGRFDWDIAFVQAGNYPAMSQAGMFAPIDYSLWNQESIEGTPSHTRLKDAVALFGVGMVVAYDQRAFPNGGPQSWADFWDAKRFPGPRAIDGNKGSYPIVEALLASGVAHKDIWPLTDDKIDRAFEKLTEIKPHVTKWWMAGGEPIQLLMNGECVMTAAFDGRTVTAIRQGAPISLAWDGAHLTYNYAAILKGGPNTASAQKLISYLNRAQIAAGWTQGTGYPGPNTNQLKHLPTDLIPLLSITPENAAKCILDDTLWLAESRPDGKTNADHVQERWLTWRAR